MLAAFPVLFIHIMNIPPLLRVCALVGSTVDISCTYSHPSGYTVYKTFWHYVRPGDFKDLREEHQFAGRVEYVGNKLRIKELKISDSGEYRFRFITNTTNGKYSGSPGVILTVTGNHNEFDQP
uniref:Immunoglobulin domain-containing protein n=1 Tax=Sinocyclocheilus grahami TaxID=75366 RepID=A0A672N553_SINGR